MEQLKQISLYALIFGLSIPIPMLFVNDAYCQKETVQEGEADHEYVGREKVPYLLFTNAVSSYLEYY